MPQPWLTESDLANPLDPMAEYAVLWASHVMWALSGRKYGGVYRTTQQYLCSSKDLPANCSWDEFRRSYWNPAIGMEVYTNGPGQPVQRGLVRFRLRNTPVRKIHSVEVGGSVLPSASYSVGNYSTLRLGADTCGCDCGPVTVDYSYGVPPPEMGHLAAIELANEILLSWAGDGNCQLPERVTSVTRQGISFDMVDPMDFLEKGRTGLLKVDLFLQAANPSKALMKPKVFSPDLPRVIKRT